MDDNKNRSDLSQLSLLFLNLNGRKSQISALYELYYKSDAIHSKEIDELIEQVNDGDLSKKQKNLFDSFYQEKEYILKLIKNCETDPEFFRRSDQIIQIKTCIQETEDLIQKINASLVIRDASGIKVIGGMKTFLKDSCVCSYDTFIEGKGITHPILVSFSWEALMIASALAIVYGDVNYQIGGGIGLTIFSLSAIAVIIGCCIKVQDNDHEQDAISSMMMKNKKTCQPN